MWINEETGHMVKAPFDLERADRLLCAIAGERAVFDTLVGIEDRAHKAGEIIDLAMTLARVALGDDLLNSYYNALQDDDEPKSDLISLAMRVRPLFQLYKGQSKVNDKISMTDLGMEILAVANGDAPKIFAKRKARQGRRNANYRQAMYRLKAVCWAKFLDDQSVDRIDVDYWLCRAFEVKDPKTIRDEWPEVARSYLGDELVAEQIKEAKIGGRFPFLPDAPDLWQRVIALEGKKFCDLGGSK